MNLYYDFENRSRWTPYAGAGIGLANVEANYAASFVRKPEQEYLAVEFVPDCPEEAKRAAAGTVSLLDDEISGWVLGYQFIVGLDMNLGEALIGVKVRWGRFGELTTTTEYDLIRSHAPVQADGVSPFGVTSASAASDTGKSRWYSSTTSDNPPMGRMLMKYLVPLA